MQDVQTEVRTILVVGATGMLGHTVIDELARRPNVRVIGAARTLEGLPGWFRAAHGSRVVTGQDVLDDARRAALLDRVLPDLVLNAVGVIKQAPAVNDRVATIAINALLPHKLARDCFARGIRLVHVSTDCVFSGERGAYTEDDRPDPIDLYGRSKLLGELCEPALTVRTSIIGHELRRHESLVDWFLRQTGEVRGFRQAIYSGVTTVEFARFLADVVIAYPELSGLWHLASEPINKYDLLSLLAAEYAWQGTIRPVDDFVCDRSMTAERLASAVGYHPPPWTAMVSEMSAARRRATASQSDGAVS